MPPLPRHLWGWGVTPGTPLTGWGKREVGIDQWRPLAHRGQHVGETMLQWPEVPVSETATLRHLCGATNSCRSGERLVKDIHVVPY